MCVYLPAKFEVASIILTSFRQGGNLNPVPPTSKGTFKKTTQIRVNEKNKTIGILSRGKDLIPYEKIIKTDSLDLKHENEFFSENTEFYSELKQKSVSVENSKYLYLTLKMRNLKDMNNLYNVQDVILLRKIFENRFQMTFDKYSFNPRLWTPASTLSGCIQRDERKVIIALPTLKNVIEIFEKTLTGCFSSVNIRLAFDIEIPMPNTTPSWI